MRKNKLQLQSLTLENLKMLNLTLELVKIILFTPLLRYLSLYGTKNRKKFAKISRKRV